MFTERTSVGLDVHARSVVAAAIDGETGELFQTSLGPAVEEAQSWMQGLPAPVAYEAGPTGYGRVEAPVIPGQGAGVTLPLDEPPLHISASWRPQYFKTSGLRTRWLA